MAFFIMSQMKYTTLISEYDYKYCYRVDVGGRGDKIWSYMKKNGNATKSPTYLDYAIVMDIDKEDLVNMVLAASTDLQIEFVETVKKVVNLKNNLAIYR